MKKILLGLFVLPLSALSMFTLIYMFTKGDPLFAIKSISVNGTSQLKEKDVAASVAHLARGTLFGADVERMSDLIRSHPMVRDVRISRVYPFSLVIDVIEKKPSALWVSGSGDIRVLDENGEPFRKMMKGEGRFFLIRASEKDEAKRVFEKVSVWTGEGLIKGEAISEVSLDQRGLVLYGRDDGLEIILGAEDDRGRLKRALSIRDDAQKKGLMIKCIDARFEKGAIIQERKDRNEKR
jgi:cell division protein FtsQ